MSLNKFTKKAEIHPWMNINCETLTCNGEELHNGDVKIKTQDGLGYNNFSTLTMGAPNQVLETNGNGLLGWIDQSGGGSDPDTIARVQNIKLPETTLNNTQIDGTTALDNVTINTLTLNGNNVATDISALQQKTTDISYTTNLTTITNSALVTSNLQVNGELQVVTDDLNTLSIKPSTLGTAGQALLSDGAGDVDFGSVVQNPVQSTINMQDNGIINLVAPSSATDAATKGYVDGIETTLSGQISTNTSNIATNTSNIATNTSNIATNTSNIATNTSNIATNTSNIATNTSNIATNTSNIATNTSNIATNTSNIATNTSDIATKATISDGTTSNTTTWSSQKIANEIAAGGSGPEFFYFNFTKGTNNQGTGFFSDAYIILGWDGFDELFIRQPTARSNVYASNLVNFNGAFPSTQSMILSTSDDDFFQASGTARIEFTISSNSDNTHPFYKIRFLISTASGLDYVYCTIEKYT